MADGSGKLSTPQRLASQQGNEEESASLFVESTLHGPCAGCDCDLAESHAKKGRLDNCGNCSGSDTSDVNFSTCTKLGICQFSL